MGDEDAFRKRIQADPRDDLTRQVFADWLDERDRHEEAAAQRNWRESVRWMKEFVAQDGIGEYP